MSVFLISVYFFNYKLTLLFYLYVCSGCMYICALRVCLVPAEVREDAGSPGTGVTDECESLCGCWEPYLGPLQEQALSTAEPAL